MKGNELSWESSITDFSFKADFSNHISDYIGLSYGASATYHKFKPGLVQNPNVNEYKLDHKYSFEYSLFASNEQKFADKFVVKYGVRFTSFSNLGPSTAFSYDANYDVADSLTYTKGKLYNT